MKIRLNHLCIIGLLSVALFSCEKDEVRAVLTPGAAPTFSATASTLVLDKTKAEDTVVTFSSTPADYGFDAGVKYTLQIDKKGNNFAEPKNVDLGSSRVKKYTVAELNSLLGLMKVTPGTAGEVELRMKTEVAPTVDPVYSNVLALTVTPFADIIEYPSVYLPGGYQGWAPDKAEKISSVKDDKVYEGYVNFPDAATAFKITPAPNWDTDYGDTGDGTAGSLKVRGSDLKVAGAGYYLIKADLNALTWSAKKTDWGIIGDATGSWDADQDMTYDATAKVWKATLTLATGALKFRANDAWDINLGDNKPANGLLTYNGENIPVAAAGQYDIVLTLSTPGNYSYTVTKK